MTNDFDPALVERVAQAIRNADLPEHLSPETRECMMAERPTETDMKRARAALAALRESGRLVDGSGAITAERANHSLLWDAAANLLDAYRDKYRKRSTEGVRKDAPLRREMGEVSLALYPRSDLLVPSATAATEGK